MITSGKSYSYWLARFNRKMSFHFPWVDPLISDRSVWHNGKQPWSCVSQILASFRFEDDDENEDKVQLLLIVRMLKSVAMMA